MLYSETKIILYINCSSVQKEGEKKQDEVNALVKSGSQEPQALATAASECAETQSSTGPSVQTSGPVQGSMGHP